MNRRHPPPRPARRASSPAPRGIPGEGRIRESRPPRRLPLQALPHTLDRGRYPHAGRGRRGGGKKPPAPVSALNMPASPTPPPSSGSPHTLDRGRYTPVGWGRRGGGKKPPPLSLHSICRHPPPRGAGAVVAIPGESRIRESRPPRRLPLQALPIRWTVGGIRPWGWGPVRGLARTTVFV